MRRVLLVALCCLCADAFAASTRGMVILLRALAYDRSFEERVSGAVDVSVVYRSDDAASMECHLEELEASKSLSDVKLAGRSLRLIPVDISQKSADDATAAEIVFLCPGIDDELETVLAAARSKGRITAAQTLDYVRAGAALGVVESGDERTLYVNLPAAKKVDAEFSSQLLGVATVIR